MSASSRRFAAFSAKAGSGRWIVAAVVAALAVAVAAPAAFGLWTLGSPDGARVFESTVFGADYRRYFEELFLGHSLWMWGQYLTVAVNYAPLYGLLYGLERITGSGSIAYFVAVAGFQLAAFASFAVFLAGWHRRIAPDGRPGVTERILPWVLAAAFVTSFANFNYLKSNLFFTLAGYSIPIQLHLADRYVHDRSRGALAVLLVAAATMNAFNATFFIYVEGLVAAYVVFARRLAGGTLRENARDLAMLAVALAPAAILIGVATVVNVPYYGTLDEMVEIMAEGMYSMNASMVNILALTTDWGLFGEFNGERYYEFAPYYQSAVVRAAAVLMIALPVILVAAKMEARADGRAHYRAWAAVAIACVFLQLGTTNPVYRWLSETFFAFQVFRNITKLAPVLVFAVLVVLHYQLTSIRSNRVRKVALLALIGAAAIHSLPYWSYADYFLRDRSVRQIPGDWAEAAARLDSLASPGSRVLTLPAIYVNDVYFWDGRKAWVQGSLADALWSVPTYRLSEGFVGPPRMQARMRALMVPDATTPRGITVDHAALGRFLADYAFDFVVVNRDLVSEYDRIGRLGPWLLESGYQPAGSFGRIDVYHAPARHRPAVSASAAMSYSRLDNLTHVIELRGVTGPVRLEAGQAYRKGWRLALVPAPASVCHEACERRSLFSYFDDFRMMFAPAIAAASHRPTATGDNGWLIDPAEVERSAPEGTWKRNSAGGIDFAVGMHFTPQFAFLAAWWAFVAACGLGVLLFIVAPRIGRR